MKAEDNTFSVCVFLSVLWLFTTPLYVYGFIKWGQFNQHFLINKRFPKITYWLAISAILEHALSTLIYWLYFYIPDHGLINFLVSCIEAFAFTAFSCILYRGFLVYLRWKQHHEAVNEVTNNNPNTDPSNDNITKETTAPNKKESVMNVNKS